MTKELLQQADELIDLYNNQGISSTFAIRCGKVQTNYYPAKVIKALADEVRGKENREAMLMDSQYRAGVQLGWNCGLAGDRKRYDAAINSRSAQPPKEDS